MTDYVLDETTALGVLVAAPGSITALRNTGGKPMTDWTTVAEYIKREPACVEPQTYTDPHVYVVGNPFNNNPGHVYSPFWPSWAGPQADAELVRWRKAHPKAYVNDPGGPVRVSSADAAGVMQIEAAKATNKWPPVRADKPGWAKAGK
jgi:hypothetical protein